MSSTDHLTMEYQSALVVKDLKLNLKIVDGPLLCVLIASYKNLPVARIKISKENEYWLLSDIYVDDFKRVSIFRKICSPGLFKNYRSKGIGTALIKELIAYAKKQSVKKIKGIIVGDISRLALWYKSLGFTVSNIDIQINF